MRIYESFVQREIDARMPRRSIAGWRETFAALTLLASATGMSVAQTHESGDAFLPSPIQSVSTVPGNGDVNPYGVAFVPEGFQAGAGPLKAGDVLVSNFNNAGNLQGTGTTIVRITRKGAATTFFQGVAPLGLSTALGVLQKGFVVVGNAPTTDGTSGTAGAGSLLVINNQGKQIQTFTNAAIQGPWDMALVDGGDWAIAFVSNALTGTVIRLDFGVSSGGLNLVSTKTVASGYVHRGDPVTLFVAPTGLVYDGGIDVLYVASTGDNTVFAVSKAASRQSDAGLGTIVYQDSVHLHGALGLARAPNGDLLVSNNDGINPDTNQPSEIVEFTTDGKFVKQLSVDPNPGGAFGLAVRTTKDKSIFAAVDDNTSSLLIWTLDVD